MEEVRRNGGSGRGMKERIGNGRKEKERLLDFYTKIQSVKKNN